MQRLKNIADLKPAPWNPREISEESFKALGYSLEEFGDLSGIVWNSRTGHLVCGHQRVKVLSEKHGDNLRFKRGALETPEGERFPIRVVSWPKKKAVAANIAANSSLLAGEFTEGLRPLAEEVKLGLPEQFERLRMGELGGLDSGNAPQTKEDSVPERFEILVSCAEEKQHIALLNEFEQRGITCRAFVS